MMISRSLCFTARFRYRAVNVMSVTLLRVLSQTQELRTDRQFCSGRGACVDLKSYPRIFYSEADYSAGRDKTVCFTNRQYIPAFELGYELACAFLFRSGNEQHMAARHLLGIAHLP